MSIVSEYEELLKTAHRIYGQYKRMAGFEAYYSNIFKRGIKSFESLTNYKRPKRITRGSVSNLKKHMHEMERLHDLYDIRKERIQKDQEWKNALWGLYNTIEEKNQQAQAACDTARNAWVAAFAEKGLEREINAIYDCFEYAQKTNQRKFDALLKIDKDQWVKTIDEYIESIENFMRKNGRRIERFAYAVIDTKSGGFNTNKNGTRKQGAFFKPGPQQQVGQDRFLEFCKKLCEALWIPQYAVILAKDAAFI